MSPAIRLKARLVDSENITDSQDFPLGQSVFRIGRHPASNLVLTEATVSGRHAAIEFQRIVDEFLATLTARHRPNAHSTFLTFFNSVCNCDFFF